jgi:hypothetical protein
VYYARIGAGLNSSPDYSITTWVDDGSFGCSLGGGMRHQIKNSLYGDLGIIHYSQCMVGKPFNKTDESASEHAYYHIEYRWQ